MQNCVAQVEVLPNIACSQGPSFSPDNTTMYYHDSSSGIRAWDYDHATGAISNERAFAQDFDLAPGQRGGPEERPYLSPRLRIPEFGILEFSGKFRFFF